MQVPGLFSSNRAHAPSATKPAAHYTRGYRVTVHVSEQGVDTFGSRGSRVSNVESAVTYVSEYQLTESRQLLLCCFTAPRFQYEYSSNDDNEASCRLPVTGVDSRLPGEQTSLAQLKMPHIGMAIPHTSIAVIILRKAKHVLRKMLTRLCLADADGHAL